MADIEGFARSDGRVESPDRLRKGRLWVEMMVVEMST